MSYKVVTEPHACVLPPPAEFADGVEIQCTAIRLRDGERKPCDAWYVRTVSGWWWNRYPVWDSKDWGW